MEPRQTDLEDLRRRVESVTANVRDRIERHPFRALALALGAGYLAGGGLFSRLTGRLLWSGVRIGLRLAAMPVVRDEVYAFIDAISDGRHAGGTEGRTQ